MCQIRGVVSVLVLALFTISCGNGGGQSTTPPIQTASGTAFMFIGDAPPPGSTILKFEITLNNATLCPEVTDAGACEGASQVSLLSAPVEIELEQLQLESAFLSLRNVNAGTFQGVRLTFANPELKLLQADNSVLELESPALQLNPATVTPKFPSAVTVTDDSNIGFLVDFNVADSIQSSGTTVTGIAPVVSLVQLSADAQQRIQEMEDTTGRVSSLNKTCPTGSFTLFDSLTGVPISNIQFDGETEFDDLSCETLADDLIVEVDIELQSPAGQAAEFFAEEIELVNLADQDDVEGVIFQVNSATEFVLLVQREENLLNVESGSFVTIDFDPANVEFRIDQDDLPVESSLFAGGGDLLAGQKVKVDLVENSLQTPTAGCATVEAGCTADAEKIKLKKGTLTARVASTSATSFTLDQLPSLFGANGVFRPLSADCQACFIGSILVTTSTATEFEDGLSGVSGLALGNIVSVRGLLFKNGFAGPSPGNFESPEMVARKVRRRES